MGGRKLTLLRLVSVVILRSRVLSVLIRSFPSLSSVCPFAHLEMATASPLYKPKVTDRNVFIKGSSTYNHIRSQLFVLSNAHIVILKEPTASVCLTQAEPLLNSRIFLTMIITFISLSTSFQELFHNLTNQNSILSFISKDLMCLQPAGLMGHLYC